MRNIEMQACDAIVRIARTLEEISKQLERIAGAAERERAERDALEAELQTFNERFDQTDQ